MIGAEGRTDMDIVLVVAVAIVAAVGGAVVGVLMRSMWASQTMKAATAEARRIEAEARARQKELILEAKDEKLRMQREAEDEARARRNELTALETRLLQRDEQLDQRTDMLEQRDRKLLERERELDKTRDELSRAHGEQVAALERVSGMSPDQAKAVLLDAVREEAEHDAVKLARAIERSAREEAQDKARDIVVTAMQRVAADHTAEHTVSVVHLPSRRDEGPDHRPRGPQHQGPRAGDRDRPDHRRHARDRDPVRASTRCVARSHGLRSPS